MSPLAAPAVAASLVAFVVVYFAVFGVGTWYILQADGQARRIARRARADAGEPIRTAGITPAPQRT